MCAHYTWENTRKLYSRENQLNFHLISQQKHFRPEGTYMNIQHDEKQEPTTNVTLPKKSMIYYRRRNKELPRQEKAKRAH